MGSLSSFKRANRMIRFVYPNIDENDRFVGCGRFLTASPDDPELANGYEPADPGIGHHARLMTAVSLLAPESFDTHRNVYECRDDDESPYLGDSAGLAYLLALIQRSRKTKWNRADQNFDIWCTGAVDIVDSRPFLKNVFQNLFDIKLRAFVSNSQDRLFILPLANLKPAHHQLLEESNIAVLSLTQFRELPDEKIFEKKTILKVHGHELTLVAESLFEKTALFSSHAAGLNPYKIFPNEMLAELFEILKHADLSENDLKNAYYASIPIDNFPAYAETTLVSAVAQLADIRKQPDHSLPILDFIQRIGTGADMKTVRRLNGLTEQIASERGISPDTKQTQPEPPCKADPFSKFAPYLLVIIKPDPGNMNKDRGKLYSVQILFWRNANEIIPWYNDSEPPVPLDNIPELLDDILVKDYYTAAFRTPRDVPKTIEFFLPFELVSCDADQWPVKKKFLKSKLGQEYHAVIRSFERMEATLNPVVHEKWAERWEQFQRLNGSDTVLWICEPDEYEAESLCDDLECEDGQRITCMMMAFQPSDENQFLYAILETGIPVALWFRNEAEETLKPQEIRDKIESLVSGKDLCRLPGIVKEIRRKAKKNMIGEHLTLFWEDRYRIPPDYWDKFDISLNAPETRK
jgi:hypothetical protein